MAVNLGLLGTFKYFDFFVGELQQLCTAIGLPVDLPVLGWILPVGISFYTFQTLSFSIDVYRGQTRPPSRFEDFALYVSFFPQLVAGPIERSSRLLPQITQPRRVTAEDFRWGPTANGFNCECWMRWCPATGCCAGRSMPGPSVRPLRLASRFAPPTSGRRRR